MAKIYYGEETKKALQNFSLGGKEVSLDLIAALGIIKKAAALSNAKIGRLPHAIAQAIIQASDEVIAGKHNQQFFIHFLQGGAGTSINMNVNEVIAERARELLRGKVTVHPLDHVNVGQSTNDVIPTAFKMVAIKKVEQYLVELHKLDKEFGKKSKEFWSIFKVGRTHLQDAVPIRLGQEFQAYQSFVKRDIKRFECITPFLQEVNIGGTSIGTGINTTKVYVQEMIKQLNRLTHMKLQLAEDLVDSTQNVDVFVYLSGVVKASAVGLSKIMNDLRLMASGPRAGLGEIILPEVQKGSSIMPGKVNPVMPETVNQIAFRVVGNDQTITMAVEAGQFELNVMMPVIMSSLIESIILLKKGVRIFIQQALRGLKANRARCHELLEKSLCMATALNQHLGYDKTAYIVKKAYHENKTLREVLLEEKLFTRAEIEKIFDYEKITQLS